MGNISDSIYKLNDEITHIPSVGDPWAMYNRGRRTGTVSIRRRPREESLKILDPQAYKKNFKNNLRAKAELKKQEKLARQTKKIYVSFACFDKETKRL